MSKSNIMLILSCTTLISCGGGGGGDSGSSGDSGGEGNIANGPVIFMTKATHTGDFEHDPTLTGNSAIEKADFFCNRDTNKPNNSYYKALLVDGVNRDAISKADWVLKPNTTYYRPTNVVIGTTNADGIFTAYWQDMLNSIKDPSENINDADELVWTGLDPRDFSTSIHTCNNWTTGDGGVTAMVGSPYYSDGLAFGILTMISSCINKSNVYCVEQKQ